jgi:hypothetical protein
MNRFELISVQGGGRDTARVEVWCHDVPSFMDGLVLAGGGDMCLHVSLRRSRPGIVPRTVPAIVPGAFRRENAAKSLLIVTARAGVGRGIARPRQARPAHAVPVRRNAHGPDAQSTRSLVRSGPSAARREQSGLL